MVNVNVPHLFYRQLNLYPNIIWSLKIRNNSLRLTYVLIEKSEIL